MFVLMQEHEDTQAGGRCDTPVQPMFYSTNRQEIQQCVPKKAVEHARLVSPAPSKFEGDTGEKRET